MSRSEREKMVAGEPYRPADPELTRLRLDARALTRAYNATTETETAKRELLLRTLLGAAGARIEIEPPFRCDYGFNLRVGDGVFVNFGCVVLDVAPVTIGARVLIGPGVQLLAATHPLDAAERASGLELGKPIALGDDVWLGGGVIVCPGASVGARSVVGAGSVVTRDLPPDVVAAGNPCRVLRSLR